MQPAWYSRTGADSIPSFPRPAATGLRRVILPPNLAVSGPISRFLLSEVPPRPFALILGPYPAHLSGLPARESRDAATREPQGGRAPQASIGTGGVGLVMSRTGYDTGGPENRTARWGTTRASIWQPPGATIWQDSALQRGRRPR